MRDATATIEFEVLRTPAGSPFFSSELRNFGGATSVRLVLGRLQASGLVMRLDSGLYVRPLRDERGVTSLPSVAQVLEAVERIDGCSVRPCHMASEDFRFWTMGRKRTLHVGTTTVRLVREQPN